MKFTVNLKSSSTAARLGAIAELRSAKDAVVPTPGFALGTRGGLVPHLTCETLKLIPRIRGGDVGALLQYPLPGIDVSTDAVKACGRGLADFVGMTEFPTYLTVQDQADEQKPGYNSQNGVSVWPKEGRKSFSAERYVQSVATFQPDMWQALVDADTAAGTSNKRLRKALERNELYLKHCVEARDRIPGLKDSAVVATVVGGMDAKARQVSALVAAESGADAFAFEGLHAGGKSALDLRFDPELGNLMKDCLDRLPEEKPRFLPGAFRPEFIVDAVYAGFDVFDSSLPYLATENGLALDIPFWPTEGGTKPTETAAASGDGTVNGLQPETKNGPVSSLWADFTFDLTDKRFTEDFGPISETCSCYTCRKHTRGYIHYLMNVKEMLAPVLLMIHNVHHFADFFAGIRSHLKADEVVAVGKR